jgi:hypothetical protein
MAKRTTGTVLREIVADLESTGGALRRLSDGLAELARSIVTGAPPPEQEPDKVIDLPARPEHRRT